MEPCDTPEEIFPKAESVSQKLFKRNGLNHFIAYF